MADQPLDISYDTSTAKTVVPLIAHNTLTRLKLNNLKVDSSEKGDATTFEWVITEPVPTSEGGQLRPGDFGATIFDTVYMYAKPDAKNPAWFVPQICKRIDALLGTGDPGNRKGKPNRPALNLAPGQSRAAIESVMPTLVGKEIVAKVAVRKDEGYGEKNELTTFMFPGDISA
jgi:hypothetical protein